MRITKDEIHGPDQFPEIETDDSAREQQSLHGTEIELRPLGAFAFDPDGNNIEAVFLVQ